MGGVDKLYIRIRGIKGAEGTVSDQFALIIPKVPSNEKELERGSNYGEGYKQTENLTCGS